jgi:hypothetical protein
VEELLPVATDKTTGMLPSWVYKQIPQLLKIGKNYNAIKIADNIGPWVRRTIDIFGFIPSGKTLPFQGFIYFSSTDINISAGMKINSPKDNSDEIIQFFYRLTDGKYSLYLFCPIIATGDIDTFFITGETQAVVDNITIDDSFHKIPIEIIGG